MIAVNGKMSFDTIKNETRIFSRYRWCLKQLFNIEVLDVHLSRTDKFSPFDFHSSMFFNDTKKIGLTEIRYTDKEIENDEECFISLDKKLKAINTNRSNAHRIFVSEQPSSLYIADLMRAKWTDIKPSKYSKEAYYFNKFETPHLIIHLRRDEQLNKKTAFELRGSLVNDYNNINNAKSILLHMTDVSS